MSGLTRSNIEAEVASWPEWKRAEYRNQKRKYLEAGLDPKSSRLHAYNDVSGMTFNSRHPLNKSGQ